MVLHIYCLDQYYGAMHTCDSSLAYNGFDPYYGAVHTCKSGWHIMALIRSTELYTPVILVWYIYCFDQHYGAMHTCDSCLAYYGFDPYYGAVHTCESGLAYYSFDP